MPKGPVGGPRWFAEREPIYTIRTTVKTDNIIETKDINDLTQTLHSDKQFYAEVDNIDISPVGFSAVKKPGEARTYSVEVTIKPEIHSNIDDALAVSNIMVDKVLKKIGDKFGELETGWEIV